MSPDEILRHAKSVIGDDSDGVPILKKAIDIIIMQRAQLFGQQGVPVSTEKDALEKRYWNLVGHSASDACDVWTEVIDKIPEMKRAMDAIIEDKAAKRAAFYYLDEVSAKLMGIFPDAVGDYLKSVGLYHKPPPNPELTRPASDVAPATGGDGLGSGGLLGADHLPEEQS